MCLCVCVCVCEVHESILKIFMNVLYRMWPNNMSREVISYEKIRRKHGIKDSSYVSFSRDFLNLEICELSLNNHRLNTSKRSIEGLKLRFQGNRVRRCLVRN